ncbi:MAG: sulfotransferase domain-containing protein, partial [Aestuariivirga sp.]|nr:sulfotransferase domain-containing protein [Aestuariivirga sp.]
HERSGTHFLINSIALNSEFTNNPLIHFDNNYLGTIINFHSAKSVRTFFHFLAEKKCSSIVKNHFASEFFDDGIDNNFISEKLKVVYIARDPFHALASYCRFINFLDMKEGPRIDNLKLFIKSEPRWGMTRYQDRQYASIAERWASHVLGWHRLSLKHSSVCFVTYQDLHENYIETIGKIFEFLEIPAAREFERPDAKKHTIHIPNHNQIEIGDEKIVRSEIWKLLANYDTDLLKRILKLN